MLDYEFLFIISIPLFILYILYLIIQKYSIQDIILRGIFYFYFTSLVAVTLFPIPFQGLDEIGKYGWWYNNFIPFASIFDIFGNNNLAFQIKLKQIIGNIILFLPLWFLISLITKKNYTFKHIISIGILWSLCIESIQFIISSILGFTYKSFDIDDILLNTLWCIIWFILYKISFPKEK